MKMPTSFLLFFCLISFSCTHFSCTTDGKSQKLENNANQKMEKMVSADHVANSTSVFCDALGDVWVGTRNGEIYCWRDNERMVLGAKDGLQGKNVMAITQLANGMHVFGTEKGINLYDGFNFQTIALPFADTTGPWLDEVYPIINPNEVHALLPLENGELWIGSGGAGAYLWDGLEFRNYLQSGGQKMPDGLHHNWISNLAQDDDGNVLFCSMSLGGLASFDGKEFTFWTEDDGLHSNMVRKVFCDRSGRILIGYKPKHGAGLSIFEGEDRTTYSEKDGLNMLSIMAICEDHSGRIWLGGDVNEVHYLENGVFHLFHDQNGNTVSEVMNMEVDQQGRVWMAGKGGLWRWDGEELKQM